MYCRDPDPESFHFNLIKQADAVQNWSCVNESRIESREGDGLTGISEGLSIRHERQQHGDGSLSNIGNAIEQTTLIAQRMIVVDMISDGFRDRCNLLIEPLKMLVDTALDRWAGNRLAIGFLE